MGYYINPTNMSKEEWLEQKKKERDTDFNNFRSSLSKEEKDYIENKFAELSKLYWKKLNNG